MKNNSAQNLLFYEEKLSRSLKPQVQLHSGMFANRCFVPQYQQAWDCFNIKNNENPTDNFLIFLYGQNFFLLLILDYVLKKVP